MKFTELVKIAEFDTNKTEKNILNNMLDSFIEMFNNKQKEDRNYTMKNFTDELRNDIDEYVKDAKSFNVKKGIIEHYLNKGMYSSSKYNVNSAFKDIAKELLENKAELFDDNNIEERYTYNMQENTKLLVCAILGRVVIKKEKASKYIKEFDDLKDYKSLSKRERAQLIKRLSGNDQELEKKLNKVISYDSGTIRDLLETEYKDYTIKSSETTKEELIKSIINSTNFLDKYKALGENIKYANLLNKSIYLNNNDYEYDEVKAQLSEKNLKRLTIEQLLAMSAFWNNRVIKSFKEIECAVYILSHPELYASKKCEDGTIKIMIEQDTVEAVYYKINLLKRICTEVYEKHEKSESNEDDYTEQIDEVYKKYEKDYRKLLDKKLLYSKNYLDEDIQEAHTFQKASYDLYKTKLDKVKVLFMSLIDNQNKDIVNYGYINEEDKEVYEKSFVLIGADIPGMNMPFRLHTMKKSILEVSESAQNGKTTVPIYKGNDDFKMRNGKLFSAQILIPVNEEKKKNLKNSAKRVNEKDKYGKTIEHLNFICNGGKMPKHMLNGDKNAIIDLKAKEDELER